MSDLVCNCTNRCLYYESSYTFHIGADYAAEPRLQTQEDRTMKRISSLPTQAAWMGKIIYARSRAWMTRIIVARSTHKILAAAAS